MRDRNALGAYLAARQTLPFAWGSNDCVKFAAGAVQAQTGRDPLAGWPTWTTRRGAQRAMTQVGELIPAVDQALTPVSPAMAQRGDIGAVVVSGPDSFCAVALVVVEGDTLVGPDASGARRLPRSAMIRAWRAD